MKKLISELWNGEPVYVLGVLSVIAGGLATAALIPLWVPPIVVGISAVIARRKVSPVQ